MSKPLWTPPFLLQTVGISFLSWVLASIVDISPSIWEFPFEAMGRRSLEVYLAAEILQVFAMYKWNEAGGPWESVVTVLMWWGVSRPWSCLIVSLIWAFAFAGFGWVLGRFGWRIKL